MATKLSTNTVKKMNPISTSDPHIYSALVTDGYVWDIVKVSGVATTDASVNAVDEYFRQLGILPTAVTLTQVK